LLKKEEAARLLLIFCMCRRHHQQHTKTNIYGGALPQKLLSVPIKTVILD